MITILSRTCPTPDCGLQLIQVDGMVACWSCDSVESWPMCQPVEDLPTPKTGPVEKALVWAGLILASLCVLVLVGQGAAWAWRAVWG